jgi:hypothetical protein
MLVAIGEISSVTAMSSCKDPDSIVGYADEDTTLLVEDTDA